MIRFCIVFLAATIFATGSTAIANIVGNDDRYPIGKIPTSLALANHEIIQIRQSTGYVICPGTKYGNPSVTSGALVHDDMVLVTTSHSFVDKYGRRREPLSECYFKTQGLIPETVKFEFTEGQYVFFDDWMKNRNVNDYAVVRLAAPLKYGQAFPLAPENEIFEGRNFTLVSAHPSRPWAPFPKDEPVVQTCMVRKKFPSVPEHQPVFYGDCDLSQGGSGSVGLVRTDNRLKAFSMASGAGPAEHDGQLYNPEAKSYSFHTSFREGVLAAILRISRAKPTGVDPCRLGCS